MSIFFQKTRYPYRFCMTAEIVFADNVYRRIAGLVIFRTINDINKRMS